MNTKINGTWLEIILYDGLSLYLNPKKSCPGVGGGY